MGWFWPQSRPECGSITDELRAGIKDLLQDDPGLQVFASESCLKRCHLCGIPPYSCMVNSSQGASSCHT